MRTTHVARRVGWSRASRAAPRACVGGLGLAAGRIAWDRVGLWVEAEVEAGVEAQVLAGFPAILTTSGVSQAGHKPGQGGAGGAGAFP